MTLVTAKLNTLIAEERSTFRAEPDDDTFDKVFRLQAQIDAAPCMSLADVVAKALWVRQLFAESGETLDDVIRSEGHTDVGMALVVLRDLLRVQGYAQGSTALSPAP